MQAFFDRLASIVGRDHVLVRSEERAPYEADWRGRYRGACLAVVRPADTAQLASVVRACGADQVAMVPQGGNTSLVGGSVPLGTGREIVVSLGRLNRLRALDRLNNTITVEAGMTLAAVQTAAEEAGRLFPLSLAAEGSCQIGGNLSTNAGGVQVLRYGNARELTLGLEVVLPGGEIWNGLRGLRKDNTGYDLKQLFIGAEGTLGFITAAVMKLFPLPQSRAVAWMAVPDATAAMALLNALQAGMGERLSAFEIVGRPALDLVLAHIPGSSDPFKETAPWYVLAECTDTCAGNAASERLEAALAGAMEQGLVRDAVLAQNGQQARALWALRENLSEAQRLEGVSIKHDISVPVSVIPRFLAQADSALKAAFPGVRIVAFGHAGDGNLHYNISKPANLDNTGFIAQSARVNRIVHDLVGELGGSISAEHGLGQLKRDELLRYKDGVELALMRQIKQALDPMGLMNPGKLLADGNTVLTGV